MLAVYEFLNTRPISVSAHWQTVGVKRVLLNDAQRHRLAVKELGRHYYYQERNHQDLESKLAEPGEEVDCTEGMVARRKRKGVGC